MEFFVLRLSDRPALLEAAADWFSSRWNIPREAYHESMTAHLTRPDAVPVWLLAMAGEQIVGGIGLIENDFHPRRDLAPNACALFVEPAWRERGVAGQLLKAVRREAGRCGAQRVYLLTDHVGFYERYGWRFLDVIVGDDGEPSRVYEAEAGV